ncbi:MAG: ATP-binding cassette domain-containing protein [Parvibaculum sp.]|uniref:ATP-binding cassette domain-containing protein n=1 Tax=Parvibaculum sp. TaxID=2024848 RepID=UPI003C75DB92
MEVLATDRLSRRFGNVQAVDNFTLSIAPGEVFGLLGRNGAGKSTLIKMLTTPLPPTSGSATVCGYDIVRQAAQVRHISDEHHADLAAVGFPFQPVDL